MVLPFPFVAFSDGPPAWRGLSRMVFEAQSSRLRQAESKHGVCKHEEYAMNKA